MIAGLTAIVWLWWRDGGISGVHNVGEGFTSFGRITGLIAGYLLALQVLLLARLPVLEWTAGFDRLTRWHGLNGKATFYVIVAHVVLITIGYAMTRGVSIFAEIPLLLSGYYGMVAAVIGTAFLIVVSGTSIAIVRGRVRYEWWYLVHLLTYVGLALVWFHETATGLDFIANPWATAWWTGLYLLTLQLLILFRIAQPVIRAFVHQLRVTRVVTEAPGVVSVHMTGKHLDWLSPRAGQFFLWRFLAPGLALESHPFSLSAAPDGKAFRITVRQLGDFTRKLSTLRQGTRVFAEGPFGGVTEDTRSHTGVALIAGGIGITPLRAMAGVLTGDVVLIYRVLHDSDIVFREELEALASRRHFKIHYVVGDHRDPKNRDLLSPDHLRRMVPDLARRDVYLCGPPAMVDTLEPNIRAAGVSSAHIHVERFALA